MANSFLKELYVNVGIQKSRYRKNDNSWTPLLPPCHHLSLIWLPLPHVSSKIVTKYYLDKMTSECNVKLSDYSQIMSTYFGAFMPPIP